MTIRANTRHHTASVHTLVHDAGTEDEVAMIDSVEFSCIAPEDAACRTYPTCDCEVFSEDEDNPGYDSAGHPYEPGQECWVKGWFDAAPCAEATIYTGADADHQETDSGLPRAERTGNVKILGFDMGIGPEWEWEN